MLEVNKVPVPEMGKLSKDSGDAQKKAAISSCIATEMKNGRPQEQAVAICMTMMRKQTGELEPTAKEGV